jgi:hypothetical protein
MGTVGKGEPAQFLTGWKAIAAHLGVDKSTAQRWVKTRGLPVKNLPGTRGKPAADPADLDAWLRSGSGIAPIGAADGVTQPETPAPDTAVAVGRRQLLRFGAAGSVLLAGIAYAWTRLSLTSEPPTSYRIEGRTLVAVAESGKAIWRHTFPLELEPAFYDATEARCVFTAIDGESRTLFLYWPGEPVDRSLICLDARGSRRWEFLPGKTVRDNLGRQFQPPYWPQVFRLVQSGNSGSSRIIVSSDHQFSFPSQVAVLDAATGKLLSEYWHRGHLYCMAAADINGDGETEILLGGVNDAPEHKQATLVIFDNRRISGATRNPRGGLYFEGMQTGTEECVVFFPRTAINRDQDFNVVKDVRTTSNSITVIVAEGIDRSAPQVVYEFDHRLRLINVMLSTELQEMYSRLTRLGEIPKQSDEQIVNDLKNGISIVRNQA